MPSHKDASFLEQYFFWGGLDNCQFPDNLQFCSVEPAMLFQVRVGSYQKKTETTTQRLLSPENPVLHRSIASTTTRLCRRLPKTIYAFCFARAPPPACQKNHTTIKVFSLSWLIIMLNPFNPGRKVATLRNTPPLWWLLRLLSCALLHDIQRRPNFPQVASRE